MGSGGSEGRPPTDDELNAPYTRHDRYGLLGMGPLPLTEKLRLAVLAVTVLPVKALGTLLMLISFWLCCHASVLLPASIRTEVVAKLGNWHCRACLACCGFWRVSWIKVGQDSIGGDDGGKAGGGSSGSGDSGGGGEPAVGIVSNHISWVDILIHMSHSFPAFVARAETRRTPIIGIISYMMGCLYVDREARPTSAAAGAAAPAGPSSGSSASAAAATAAAPSSSSSASTGSGSRVSDAVVARMRDMAGGRLPHARPLLLFPEGTTTNGRYLLPFKTGAFLAGLPLRPVVIRYGEGRVSPSWEMIPAARHIFLMLANPVHCVTCFELPVYRPSAAERADPRLYAANVRRLMMDFAGLRDTQATYQDKMALMQRLKREHGMA